MQHNNGFFRGPCWPLFKLLKGDTETVNHSPLADSAGPPRLPRKICNSIPSLVANLLHCPPAASCVLYKESKWECCLILNISSLFDHFIVSHIELSTVETAYKVCVCPRGNLLYMWIYLITDLKLL